MTPAEAEAFYAALPLAAANPLAPVTHSELKQVIVAVLSANATELAPVTEAPAEELATKKAAESKKAR